MDLFCDSVLWQRIYMQPCYILFQPYWVWQQMYILDDFISGLFSSESTYCNIAGFTKDVSREVEALFNTPYFKCIDGGCGFKDQPEDTEILNTNHIINGEHCLLIDDEHPQSIFNEYYARTFYTSGYMEASYIRHSYWDCYKEYEETINRLSSLLDKIKGLDNEEQSTLNKMAYLNVISAFDSFICSILLVRLVNNENAFNLYADKVFSIS